MNTDLRIFIFNFQAVLADLSSLKVMPMLQLVLLKE